MEQLYVKELSTDFIQAMVQSMYKYEAKIVDERLLNEEEMLNFYDAYMQGANAQAASVKPNTRG